MAIETLQGTFQAPPGARFVIVSTRWNEFIVDRLVEGALDALRRHGIDDEQITLVRVPGSFEIPVACKQLIDAGGVDAILALGCVIRGATAHFEYVASSVTSGCSQLAVSSGIPVVFGVLTTDTIEQAVERAGTKAGNKGAEAATVAIEMLSLKAAIVARGATKPAKSGRKSR
ncbi:MAG TPA: 6,7-dimethyl-8-ribityllumazine synthase [Polyangiales bacterium]|nr:6,7-dimethyl-8-ribityllumazine synthase [Polyangiales bacterium]